MTTIENASALAPATAERQQTNAAATGAAPRWDPIAGRRDCGRIHPDVTGDYARHG